MLKLAKEPERHPGPERIDSRGRIEETRYKKRQKEDAGPDPNQENRVLNAKTRRRSTLYRREYDWAQSKGEREV